MKIRVGLFGFGKTGKLVEDEFIKDDNFNLTWVVKNIDCGNKYASRLLGYEEDCGKIFAAKNLDKDFFKNNRVDVIIDFSHQQALYYYENAANLKIPIISAVFNFRLMLFKICCLLWEIVKSRIVNKDMIDLPIYYLKSKSAVIS